MLRIRSTSDKRVTSFLSRHDSLSSLSRYPLSTSVTISEEISAFGELSRGEQEYIDGKVNPAIASYADNAQGLLDALFDLFTVYFQTGNASPNLERVPVASDEYPLGGQVTGVNRYVVSTYGTLNISRVTTGGAGTYPSH